METKKILKTNIKCGACKATVKPFLDAAVGESNWEVDLTSPDRIVTVNGDLEKAKDAINKAGYKAEEV